MKGHRWFSDQRTKNNYGLNSIFEMANLTIPPSPISLLQSLCPHPFSLVNLRPKGCVTLTPGYLFLFSFYYQMFALCQISHLPYFRLYVYLFIVFFLIISFNLALYTLWLEVLDYTTAPVVL